MQWKNSGLFTGLYISENSNRFNSDEIQKGVEMAPKPRKPMRLPAREDKRGLSSGAAPARGRPRTIDVSETGLYHTLSLNVSPRTYKNLQRVKAETGMNQNEFILTKILPEIDKILIAAGFNPNAI